MNAAPLTPATEAKAAAIRAGLIDWNPVPIGNAADLLAMLTSANKEEREQAKSRLRSITRHGQQILAAEKAAQDLATFANRNEP